MNYCAACHHPMLDNDFRHICQSVLEDRVRQLEKALAESIAQTERWTVQANQYAVALDESRGHVIQMRSAIKAVGPRFWGDVLDFLNKGRK